ncbi:MAG: prenyltransferase/squalene oxidase repeat-containing protein [Gemmataceae bacterium]
MRPAALALVLLAAPAARAQTPEVEAAIRAKLGAARYALRLEDPAGGFAPAAGGKPGLRATSACVRTLKYTGTKTPNADKHAAFVMSCFDPKTGGFADAPGGKADVTLTSVGVMAAAELGVPKERYRKALDYLKDNARTFEDVRIAAAGVEAWGVKDSPFDVKPWVDAGREHLKTVGLADAREVGSATALALRLGGTPGQQERLALGGVLTGGQRPDGGWGKAGAKGSDLETTYRVMRALVLLNEPPANPTRLRAFLASCRNADGGSGVATGEPSGAGPTYYSAIVTHWLAGFEK